MDQKKSSNQHHGCAELACSRLTSKRCGHCHVTHYCSKACQQKDWKRHKQVCHELKLKDWPPRDVQAPSIPEMALLISQLGSKEDLVLQVVEYALPKILTAWKMEEERTGQFKGAVSLTFSNASSIQDLMDAYNKGRSIREVPFSLGISLSSLDTIRSNPLLGSMSVQEAIQKRRTFVLLGWEPSPETRMNCTVTEIRVVDGRLVRD